MYSASSELSRATQALRASHDGKFDAHLIAGILQELYYELAMSRDGRGWAFKEDVEVAQRRLDTARKQTKSTHRERDRERCRPDPKISALIKRLLRLRVHLEELEKAGVFD